MHMRAFGVGLVLMLALAAGCSTPQGGARGINDGSASLAIKSRMLRSSQDFSGVDAIVVDGLVLLIGNVPTAEAKDAAGRIAWSAPNVRDVANELEIDEDGRSFFGVGDQRSVADVRARLVADRQIRATSVHVECYNGVIYLLGRTRTSEEARRVAGHASLGSGVKRVVSFLRAEDSVGIPPTNAPYDPFAYEGEETQGEGPADDGGLLGGPSE